MRRTLTLVAFLIMLMAVACLKRMSAQGVYQSKIKTTQLNVNNK